MAIWLLSSLPPPCCAPAAPSAFFRSPFSLLRGRGVQCRPGVPGPLCGAVGCARALCARLLAGLTRLTGRASGCRAAHVPRGLLQLADRAVQLFLLLPPQLILLLATGLAIPGGLAALTGLTALARLTALALLVAWLAVLILLSLVSTLQLFHLALQLFGFTPQHLLLVARQVSQLLQRFVNLLLLLLGRRIRVRLVLVLVLIEFKIE